MALARQLADAVLHLPQRHWRDAPFRLLAGREAKPEQLAPQRTGHRAFLAAYLQLQHLLNEPRQVLKRTSGRAAQVDVAVVRVAHESQAPAFQFPIQLVEDEVRQQGRRSEAEMGRSASLIPGVFVRGRGKNTDDDGGREDVWRST